MNPTISAFRNYVAPMVKSTSRLFGYELWPTSQFSGATLLGLKNFPILTIFDIGALNGSMARDLYMSAFPRAVIHCFEPSPRIFPKLAETAKLSKGRIIAHNIALGDESGKATFYIAVNALASSSLLPSTEECHAAYPRTTSTILDTVEIRTLDEIADVLAPKIADDLLIKMDVQGFEDRVIRGGLKTFARARACVMEVQRAHFYDGQPSFRDLFLMMDGLGFEFVGNLEQVHGPEGNVLFFDAVFIKTHT